MYIRYRFLKNVVPVSVVYFSMWNPRINCCFTSTHWESHTKGSDVLMRNGSKFLYFLIYLWRIDCYFFIINYFFIFTISESFYLEEKIWAWRNPPQSGLFTQIKSTSERFYILWSYSIEGGSCYSVHVQSIFVIAN